MCWIALNTQDLSFWLSNGNGLQFQPNSPLQSLNICSLLYAISSLRIFTAALLKALSTDSWNTLFFLMLSSNLECQNLYLHSNSSFSQIQIGYENLFSFFLSPQNLCVGFQMPFLWDFQVIWHDLAFSCYYRPELIDFTAELSGFLPAVSKTTSVSHFFIWKCMTLECSWSNQIGLQNHS